MFRRSTKIDILIVSVIVLSIFAASVVSVTRTITNSHDDIYTFIVNSNGNYWQPTSDNLQLAINDVGTYGTVWVGSDITLTSAISLSENHGVIIDFQGNQMTLNGDISFLNMTSTNYATIKNAFVKVSSSQTNPIIHMYIRNGGQTNLWAERLRFNTFENIVIENSYSPQSNHDFAGIHMEILGYSNMLFNTFDNIRMYGVGTGILLEAKHSNAYGNGNYFENIWIDQFETMIQFDVTAQNPYGFNENIFQDVKGQTCTWSMYGFRDISNSGNHFYGCLAWDWSVSGRTYDWIIDSSAWRTKISAHYIANIQDNGVDTDII